MDKVRSATSGLQQLAKTIAVPRDHAPLRLPSFPNLERTAVCPFMTTGTFQLSSAAGGGTRKAFLCRSPTFPLWVEQIPEPSRALSQFLTVVFASTVELPPGIGIATTFGKLSADVLAYNERGWAIANSQKYSWPNAIDETNTFWFFTPKGLLSAAYISFTGNVTAGFELDVEVIGTGATNFEGTTTTISGTAAGTAFVSLTSANVSGWWRPLQLRIISGGGGGNSIAVSGLNFGWTTGGDLLTPTNTWSTIALWPFSATPEIRTSSLPFTETRCNASSCLFTNVTKVMAKEGTIMAARFNSSTVPILGFDATNMASTHPKEKYFGGMEHGFYAYSLPDEAAAQFADSIVIVPPPTGEALPLFNFSQIGYFTAILFNDYDVSDASTMAVTVNWHTEYRSSSTLFPLGFSTTTLEAYHGAQMSLASMGTMFENPLHLSAIASLASAAAKRFLPVVAPYVMPALKAGGNYILSAAANKLKSNFSQAGVGPSNVPKRQPRAKKPVVKKTRSRPAVHKKKGKR